MPIAEAGTYEQGLYGQERFGPTGDLINRSLDLFRRKRRGYGQGIRNDFYSNLGSTAYTAGQGVTNQMVQGLRSRGLGRSAAFLTAPQAGARTQGAVFRQGALPFARSEADLAERQLQADRAAGLNLYASTSARDLALRNILAQIWAKRKDSEFNLDELLGNLAGAGAQVGAAAV